MSEPSSQIDYSNLRVPPNSVEAESSVLGGLLLDNSAWDHVADVLVYSDFYRHEHKLVYSAIGELVSHSRPADVITVYEHLQALDKGEEVGGLGYLNALAQYVPSAGNIRRYAEIVRERAILRKLTAAGDEIVSNAMNTQGRAVDLILDEAEQKIFKIGEEGSRMKQGPRPMSVLIPELIDHVQKMADRGDEITGLSTGLHGLDSITSGLQGGDLIILAARPSMGKTALAINIAEHVALNEHKPVVVFSMEMGEQQLTIRSTGSVSRIDQSRLRTGKLTDDEWSRFAEASERLARAPFHIDGTPALSSNQLRASSRRLARQTGGLALIVVDYLQLMVGGGEGRGAENRAYELAEITRGLKALAKELDCPIIALSQLSRKVEERTDKRPLMSDLRESGAIEQDADVIMFIYRDDYYNKESKEPGIAELIIAKQRSGPVGKIKLAFLSAITKFESLGSVDV